MQSVTNSQETGVSLNSLQLQFLKTKGFSQDKTVVDCDPDKQTITFSDGRVRTATEIWSRAMGYFRPVEFWNTGKQAEHRERVYFKDTVQ